jgi:adenylate cyclase
MGKGRWPLPRAVYSYALERLFELGAKTIVIDILYVSSQTSLDPRLNAALDRIDEAKGEVGISDELIGDLEAVLGDEGVLTPAVYLGLQRLEAAKSQLKLTDPQMARIQQILKREGKRVKDGDEPFAETLERHKGKVVLAFSNNKSTDENGKATIQFLKPNSVLTEALGADGLGYAFFQPDVDGVVRRVESFTSQFKESNMGHLQSGPDDWLRFSPLGVQKFTGKAMKPQSEIINYRGAAGTFEVLPIEELFSDPILKSDPRYEGGARFKDKLIYLGPISETFHDEHRTPLGTQPGVEIHAHYGAALLDEKPILEFPKSKELWLLVGALIVSAALLMALERVLLRMGIGVAVVFGYVAVSYVLFATKHVMLPVVVPLLAVFAVGGVITMFDFAIEQLEKAHVRGVLDKYVSSNVASMVINQGDSFDQALRGQNKAVSVLFSDIRGFTSLSESRTPEKLVEQLNEYFLQMVDRVLGQQGTLQKFIGDAIMAVWGDTHSLGTTVDCMGAVRAALKMRVALAELNAGWGPNPDREELSIGVGINHGHVVVGELGHPQRMEFTCLGDGVNLAARLESATKQFGVDILVAEEAEKLTRDQVVYRRVDLAVFKGKTQPIAVFTPLGETGMDVPAWLAKYHAALDLFHERKFEAAKSAFDAVNAEMGGEDYLCKMYHKRCDHYLQNPPEADWNGSWVLTDK